MKFLDDVVITRKEISDGVLFKEHYCLFGQELAIYDIRHLTQFQVLQNLGTEKADVMK